MKLTVEELRTLQLALINMESGLTESGIAKMQSLSNKLEVEVQRLTKRALDGRKRGAKSKSLNGKGGSKAARQ